MVHPLLYSMGDCRILIIQDAVWKYKLGKFFALRSPFAIFAPQNRRLMNEEILKKLKKDEDGLLTYEYIANNIGKCDSIMPELVTNIINVDRNGQFAVSTARYLNAINKEKYAACIDMLVKASIEKDREHKYIPDLLSSLWGADYDEHVAELNVKDDNFRRIYKRVYPKGI